MAAVAEWAPVAVRGRNEGQWIGVGTACRRLGATWTSAKVGRDNLGLRHLIDAALIEGKRRGSQPSESTLRGGAEAAPSWNLPADLTHENTTSELFSDSSNVAFMYFGDQMHMTRKMEDYCVGPSLYTPLSSPILASSSPTPRTLRYTELS